VLKDYRKGKRPFTVGHPDFAITQLPARDATASGNIKRSNRFPNDSYFTEWISTEDQLTWNIEVLKQGSFDVVIHQSCAPEDLNALMELEFNGSRLRARYTKVWNPPVRGGEHDRVKRQESYVKDFKPFKMGRIKLKKGRGPLRFKAMDLPGNKAPEFRLMELIRITD
ncbi:MAG: N-acetylgalactosamine 6-sulfate sulfatase, partial [Verrucomicrobia bacterium]|nr:N-acetylgalactosamine 6-sulfate sulfatase [Verrucomicrobiota bacterium]